MKYISLIDELRINIGAIPFINAYRIEQIQKQLEFEATLDSSIKLTELSQLVSQLKNPVFRDSTVFIERHLWLKNILLENYNLIEDTSFDATYDPRAIADDTKTYITPFLLETLTPALHYLLTEKKIQLLTRVVSLKRFFSDEVQQEITTFFKTQLNTVTNYITAGKLKESQTPIAFLSNAGFIESIQLYIEELPEELTALNSAIVNTYDLNQNTRNNEWVFAVAVMIAFGKLTPSNQQQREVFTKNASIAKSSKFKPSLLDTERHNTQKRSSINTYPIMIIGVIIFLTIGIIVFISKSNFSNRYDKEYNDILSKEIITEDQESPYTYSDEPVVTEEKEIEKSIIEITEPTSQTEEEKNISTSEEATPTLIPEYTTLPNQVKRHTQDNHIRFLYSLKKKVVRGNDKEPNEIIRVTPFTNPYPKTFNTISTDATTIDTRLEVNNSTQKDLIVFKLQDGIDQAIIIPENEKGILDFKQGDSIAFYSGNDFTSSRFSHFTKKQDISTIYKITSVSKHAKIDVLPFKDNSGSANNPKFHRSIESLTFYDVKAEKLKTIETLYRDYYNRYYQK